MTKSPFWSYFQYGVSVIGTAIQRSLSEVVIGSCGTCSSIRENESQAREQWSFALTTAMGSSKQQDYAGAARAGVGRKSAKPLIKHAHAALQCCTTHTSHPCAFTLHRHPSRAVIRTTASCNRRDLTAVSGTLFFTSDAPSSAHCVHDSFSSILFHLSSPPLVLFFLFSFFSFSPRERLAIWCGT